MKGCLLKELTSCIGGQYFSQVIYAMLIKKKEKVKYPKLFKERKNKNKNKETDHMKKKMKSKWKKKEWRSVKGAL